MGPKDKLGGSAATMNDGCFCIRFFFDLPFGCCKVPWEPGEPGGEEGGLLWFLVVRPNFY